MSRKSLIITNADKTFSVEYVTNHKTGADLFTVSDVIGLDFAEGHFYPMMDKGSVYGYGAIKKFCVDNKFDLTEQTLDTTNVTSKNSVELDITTETLEDGAATAVQQVETATVVGVITTAGDATVTITSALFAEDEVISVAVAENDDQDAIALKIRTEVALNETVVANFTISGDADKFILTAIDAAVNDETLNIAIDNDTSVGITTAATSENTTAGVAPTPYEDTVEAEGGNGNYVFEISDGDLPAGLTISSGGVISGIPTASGVETFTVKVSDLFTSSTQELTLTVN